MDSGDYLDLDAGLYDSDPALVEQQRAYTLENLRTSKAVSATYLAHGSDDDIVHWAFVENVEASFAVPFLISVLVRAWRDVEAAGLRRDLVAEMVSSALSFGDEGGA